MPNGCARKCCHCVQKGHNSTTCNKGCVGFKLFGVQIDVPSDDGGESTIRKSKSLDNLEAFNLQNAAAEVSGYLSDGFIHQSSKSHDRKKGKQWSEDEHRSFLAGLDKLGKGDWKGIASKYVPTRNSSQVASHAQKYFIRLAATEKKRRRASVFDIPLTDNVNQTSQVMPGSQADDHKAAESSHLAKSNNLAASSNTMSELQRQASIPAYVGTSERPPLSPMKRHGFPDHHRSMFFKPRVSSFGQGYPREAVMPAVSWVPFVNVSGQSNSVFLPSIHGTLATFVPLQPSSVAALHKGSSLGGSAAAPATNNDELLKIRKLTL